MGKGALDYEDLNALGTVGLQSRDYALAGFEDADVVITVGYDLVEHAPSNWNPNRNKTIICIDSVPSEVDEYFVTAIDLVGDLYHILSRLTEELRHEPRTTRTSRLDDIVLGRFEAGKDDDAFPMQPPRVLWEIRQALGRHDMLISDVGLHKLWIARMFPAHEPNTVLIANGLAGMGIALPTAIAAKLVHPGRRVVTVNGDGGFLMNVQELETAVRLKTPIVNVIWENSQFGSIVWKQDKKFGRHFGTDFTQPGFRQAGGRLRHAGLALRGGRGLRQAPATRAVARAPEPDRGSDRLLARRVHLGGARNGDGGGVSATQERTAVDAVPTQLFIGGEWRDGRRRDLRRRGPVDRRGDRAGRRRDARGREGRARRRLRRAGRVGRRIPRASAARSCAARSRR